MCIYILYNYNVPLYEWVRYFLEGPRTQAGFYGPGHSNSKSWYLSLGTISWQLTHINCNPVTIVVTGFSIWYHSWQPILYFAHIHKLRVMVTMIRISSLSHKKKKKRMDINIKQESDISIKKLDFPNRKKEFPIHTQILVHMMLYHFGWIICYWSLF